MRKNRKTINMWFLGKIPRRVAVLIVVLIAISIVSAIAATTISLNYAVIRARVLFLEKITARDYVPEDIDELYERALKLQAPIDLTPQLAKILEICEQIEKHLDRPVITNSAQLKNFKGGNVYLVGVVTRVSRKDPHLFLTVNDISAPIFNIARQLPEIKVGYKVAIVGTVNEYQGQLQVVANNVNDIWILETTESSS
jgi:hypothetical protein